ncbi:hypothetical protein AGDE_04415 [Angomonas deanei]|nr:hypothetical protein AGDE_04415 [Angomonas deanei]|eukprot:EPY39513.1 hypothetical protein AGDE_04415 [Angomonas deanei]
MRKLFVRSCSWQKRFIASYNSAPLTHELLIENYPVKAEGKNILDLLTKTENTVQHWKLNKWELRVPPFLSGPEKESYLLLLNMVKSLFLQRKAESEQIRHDITTVCNIAGISEQELYDKNRQWLQEVSANLRWKGEVNKAKMLRDSFLRLEVNGSKNYKLLERLCCMYGLGILGTFDDAFGGLIEEDPRTKKLTVSKENYFQELLSEIVTKYPDFDIIFQFLGFSGNNGYRNALRKFMGMIIAGKHGKESVGSGDRVLFYDKKNAEILFDFADSKNSISTNDSVYGLPDFFVMRNTDIYLITIASDNHWLRARQVPHPKQVEGIARRCCFVFGLDYDSVRVKQLLLPPAYVDDRSIERICQSLGVSVADAEKVFPWLKLYKKELDETDIDYCELEKTVNNEEWVKL